MNNWETNYLELILPPLKHAFIAASMSCPVFVSNKRGLLTASMNTFDTCTILI